MLTTIGCGNRRVYVSKQNYSCLATVWSPTNMGPVLLSHESILSLSRLRLSPMFPRSQVPSFSTPLQDKLLYCNDIIHQVTLSRAPMVCGFMMLSEVITKVYVSWFPFYFRVLMFHSITYPIKSHFHVFSTFCLMVPFMMTSAVKLSVIISVFFCGWPISLRVVLSASIYLALQKNAPHSASSADDIKLRMMVSMTIIAPFGRLLSLMAPPMQKNILLYFFLVITKNMMCHCVL